MGFEVKVTEQADNDLRRIFEYIAFELKSSGNAVGQLDRLEKGILSLEEFPERFPQYQKEPWTSRGLRFMPVDHYLACFIVNIPANLVNVIRVMYGGRDLEHELNEKTKY
ncbi:type II toxin-antitoxin system RelE/ParE family toxin [Rummeliibacillus suwonensis]|uniref:type II toxin-antitoxin system RelE/ParE family toxin n=1 Tax=Rummeliibacillus suwonensis TaxID=1306154 RepID=UPI001AAE9087|nr:type II toxin-antitoxin system RelE/ParE family toxin [Rummeliibacillus suwonensis]MBO2536537.1 type II toxin-antitoxin system RelE/ParE family toxin [Rummeliibacillus suwonensis]